MLASARALKQGSDLLAGRGLLHRSASPVMRRDLRTAFEQQADNARLLFTRLRRTASSSPGVLNSEVQGR
jgi:hypothetical protein